MYHVLYGLCICPQVTQLQLFSKAFQANRKELIIAIYVDERLWSQLKTREVLTEHQLTECQGYVRCQ